MSQLVRRLLGLLFTLGFYDKHYKIDYTGEVVSFNSVYSGGHWSKRSGIKNSYNKIFSVLLAEANVKPMKEMSLVVFFNTKHDTDNLGYILKMIVDTMKGKYIENDGNKIFKRN